MFSNTHVDLISGILFYHHHYAVLVLFLPPATKLGQGNIFRSVCQQFCPWGGMRGCPGGRAWFLFGGGMRGFIGGACMVLFSGGGMRGFIQWGACVVLFRGHAWFLFSRGVCMVLFSGGMHGFIQRGACMVLFGGACMVFSVFSGYNEIRSMSGQYASYWNAFLLVDLICQRYYKLIFSSLPPANEVRGKVIFSQACVKNSVHRMLLGECLLGGVPARWGLLWGITGPGGVHGPRGSAPGGAWSGGGLLLGGLPGLGGSALGGCLVLGVPGSGGCLVETPPDGYCCGRYASYWNAFLLIYQNI